MKFQKWNERYHLEHTEGFDKETVDCYMVQMIQLMAKEQKKGIWGSEAFPYGHISADSFEIEENKIVSFSQGMAEMEYCPMEEANLSTDFFALGLILYEMIKGESYCKERNVFLALDYEQIREKEEKKGKTSLLDESDIPLAYKEFGTILKEFTLFSREDRIQSFEELPNAIYEWECWDVETKRMLGAKRGIIERLDEEKNIPSICEWSGAVYEICPEQNTLVSYSFLSKKYQVWYRKRQEEREWQLNLGQELTKKPETKIDKKKNEFVQNTKEADLGLMVKMANGNLKFITLLLAGEQQVYWKAIHFSVASRFPETISLGFWWRKAGHKDVVLLYPNESLFQKAGDTKLEILENVRKRVVFAQKSRDTAQQTKGNAIRIEYALKEEGVLSIMIQIGKENIFFLKSQKGIEKIELSSPNF